MNGKVYLNGSIVDADHARISVTSPAFLHGVGLFETLRTYGGRPFRLARHIERMRESAARLGLPVGDAIGRIPSGVEEVLAANGMPDARVRITVAPAGGPDGRGEAMLLITVQEAATYPEELYRRGMTVWLDEAFRQSSTDPLAGHKTTCYFARLLALRRAREQRCDEAIWLTPDDRLAEGCVSNIFLVRDGVVRTPPTDTPVLPGVTRAAVLELAPAEGLRVEEGPCTPQDLMAADEVFLTNAVMEIMPVTRIGRRAIADEKVGPRTQRIAAAYRELTRTEAA